MNPDSRLRTSEVLCFEPYRVSGSGLESVFAFAGGARIREPERGWTEPRARSHEIESLPDGRGFGTNGFLGPPTRPGAPRHRFVSTA